MITLSDLRRELNLEVDREPELQGLLDEVVALWERETGRLWTRRAGYVQVLRPVTDVTRSLWLELWPVEALTKVEERPAGGQDWAELEAEEYVLDGSHELARLGGPYWAAQVRVTYTGGVVAVPPALSAQAPTPADVRRALLTQARYAQARWDASRAHVARQGASQGGSTEYLTGECHPVFEAAAKRHRRVA